MGHCSAVDPAAEFSRHGLPVAGVKQVLLAVDRLTVRSHNATPSHGADERSGPLYFGNSPARSELVSLSDTEFQSRAIELRVSVEVGSNVTSPDLLMAGFAFCAEAVRRVHGKILHDVQLLGGLVMASGAIAEMATGEGKTLTGAAPAFLHALSGRGVHVMTSNSYLAERDCEELRPVFEMLGLTVAVLPSKPQPP